MNPSIRTLNPAKIAFKNEDEIKTFQEKKLIIYFRKTTPVRNFRDRLLG